MIPLRPMKGIDVLGKLDRLYYPKWLQPKYDGIRVLFYNGTALSSSLKPLANEALQKIARLHPELDLIECEYYVPPSEGGFREATSICRNKSKSIDKGLLYAFDKMVDKEVYAARFNMLFEIPDYSFIRIAPTCEVESPNKVSYMLKLFLEDGFEGVMLKGPGTVYKHGRSTINSQECLKLKPFVDDDARVIGYKLEQENDNPAYVGELGLLKRSSSQLGKYDKPLVGALHCICDKFAQPFWVSGFTMEEKEAMFKCRETLTGRVLTFKHQPCDCYDAPRHPIFRRWL